jgi:predicted AAA+ superfamily ATPase
MYRRLSIDRLHTLAARFPALLILGARQVGKTTLARQAFADHAYVDLEDPRTRETWTEDPRFQLDSHAGRGLILDEAQAVPELFAALRGVIDAQRDARGRFIVLGSAQPTLVRGAAESLAGRVGMLELDPLVVAETAAADSDVARRWHRHWLCGGFPDAYAAGPNFRNWQEAYLRAYIERDLPQLGVAAEPLLARRLLTMLAHQQGGLLNVSNLAAALGVGHAKVARLIDAFEATFILRRLTPWFRNVGKRLTKAPKLYLRDSGMLHHLLDISDPDQLAAHPIRGASWEGFVLEDLLRREQLAWPQSRFHFWRTAAGGEIDLLIERGAGRHAIEIKAGHASPRQARHLGDMLDDAATTEGWIVDQDTAPPGALNPTVRRRGFGDSVDWLP